MDNVHTLTPSAGLDHAGLAAEVDRLRGLVVELGQDITDLKTAYARLQRRSRAVVHPFYAAGRRRPAGWGVEIGSQGHLSVMCSGPLARVRARLAARRINRAGAR